MERPTVELGVGELDPLGAERLGEPDQCLDLVEITAVQHHVDGQGKPQLPRVVVCRDLVPVGRGARDLVRQLGIGALNADLHMVEPRGLQAGQPLPGEPVGRGDQRGI